MHKVVFEYKKINLDDLMNLEKEVIHKISPYCEDTNKTIETMYSVSIRPPFLFTLQIIVTQNEKRIR